MDDDAKSRLATAMWKVYRQWEKDWVRKMRQADEAMAWEDWFHIIWNHKYCVGYVAVADTYSFSGRSGSWPS